MKLTLSHDGCIIYKFGFTQNLYGGTILTAKGINKKFCPFRKKAILFDQNTIFSIGEIERKEIQLEIFQSVWVSSQSPSSYS